MEVNKEYDILVNKKTETTTGINFEDIKEDSYDIVSVTCENYDEARTCCSISYIFPKGYTNELKQRVVFARALSDISKGYRERFYKNDDDKKKYEQIILSENELILRKGKSPSAHHPTLFSTCRLMSVRLDI